MPPFKDSFQDRVGRAAEAKRKALDNLRAKAPVDEAVAAERLEAARQREARVEEKRSAKAEKAQAADAARAAEAAKAAEAAAEASAAPPPPTEAELKAARDARYAARKSRK
ncbi:MAG TPA: DUF6481 family protein [Allosphingosinicella sp.]|nr:DUF6481 family protein [Allosphingosinicella sp.]